MRSRAPRLAFASLRSFCSALLGFACALSFRRSGPPFGASRLALRSRASFRPSLPRSLPEREKLPFLPLPLLDPGDFLLSQAVPSSVPSAFGGLTSVFGMGTGGSLQPLSPETLMSPSRALTSGLFARFRSRFRLRSLAVRSTPSKLHRVQVDLQAFTFSLDQALDRLVSPSSTPHSASTDDLSTSSSLRGLTCFKQWQSSSSGGLHA